MSYHRGNILLLKRPLADFICVVEEVKEGEGKIKVRYIDMPPNEEGFCVGEDDVIKLAEQQEKELPSDFLAAVEKQREVVFAKKKETKKGVSFKDISDDTFGEILKILQEDNNEEEKREGNEE